MRRGEIFNTVAARTARRQTTARMWGDIWHVDGVARVLRNELFRQRDLADDKYLDWLYGVWPSRFAKSFRKMLKWFSKEG